MSVPAEIDAYAFVVVNPAGRPWLSSIRLRQEEAWAAIARNRKGLAIDHHLTPLEVRRALLREGWRVRRVRVTAAPHPTADELFAQQGQDDRPE